ncbi:photosystem II S4 domain protein [Coccomyxa subellipsoidea C-169]|uniref:Photosystem II S4 domain protein n=1 Tax=Coccomyxa subellipsoidea (strain C-169) TaxID=574566 RepID=I0YWJ0_COCSC|nr:photosystem II S4 domain protein [Coccomyxa subellipsoidea C-169]EIE22759.1 photosystem II S4 domain protein [Coccomyxa subellipsoidea C-169]|eukprot:XP_005647303.1 photosystem II S4 domain protein [Coccomyxa subellipsoidea C-169]
MAPHDICGQRSRHLLGLVTVDRRSFRTQAGKDDLLKGVNPQHRDDVARVVEQAQRAASMWTTICTDFHPPPVVADAMNAMKQLAGVAALSFGGYAQAERTRIFLGQEDIIEALKADPQQVSCKAQAEGVAALRVQGNFMFDAATHRDFLGAILGTGIERSKVGDIILVGETGAQILVAEELLDHFELNLTQVRSVPVVSRRMELAELSVRPAKTETVRSVEASLRLDAVASAGFRISRAKAADLIKQGDVRVNWIQAKGSSLVKEGDVISCSGKGRIEIISTSLTKKDRHAVEMTRYV